MGVNTGEYREVWGRGKGRMSIRCLGWLLLPLLIFGCKEANTLMQNPKSTGTSEGITDSQLKKLAGKRIYFGHQSVGYNILDGVRDVLGEFPAAKITMTEFDGNSVPVEGRGILHSRIGKNGEPSRKIESFRKIVLGVPGMTPFDVAFFKFCYVDFQEDTNLGDIFEAYKKNTDEIQAALPGLVLVHMTVPLTSGKVSWIDWVKSKVFRKRLQSDGNLKRNQWNDLLRTEYGKKAHLFDLAFYESTLQNGNRSIFRRGGKDYEMLQEEYTEDGGHLNRKGRTWVAVHFLMFLNVLMAK
jgi:hypothetical protein